MADVASVAGVSMKSVSRVINKEPHVTPRLRAKVEAAIAALNYVPDAAARSLAGMRSFTIGVLFDSPGPNSAMPNYIMKVQAGIYRACVEHQHHMRIESIDDRNPDMRVEEQLAALVRNGRPDGLVLTPPICDDPRILDFCEAEGIRYSRIAPATDPGRSPAVAIDDEAAAAQVAELFWSNGHRRIGLISGPDRHSAGAKRRKGFLDRLRGFDPDIVVDEAAGDFSFAGGIQAGGELLSAKRPPTAIFAANDDSAAGAIFACHQAGFAVPDNVSICGFDDSWITTCVWPYLTTVHQPIEEMAHTAACQLFERRPDTAEPAFQMLDFKLIERDSIADLS